MTEQRDYWLTTDIDTDAVIEAVAVEWTGSQTETYNMCAVDDYLDRVSTTPEDRAERTRMLLIKAVELLGMSNDKWHDTYAVPNVGPRTGNLTEAERIERGLRINTEG